MPPRGERKEGTHRPKVAPPEGELKTLSLHPDLRLRRADELGRPTTGQAKSGKNLTKKQKRQEKCNATISY